MHRYTVESSDLTTPTTLRLTLRAQNEERLLAFQPGQYAAIGFRRGVRPSAMRCFSIASSPTQQGVLQFGIRISGKFTHRLAQVKPGEAITVSGPFGGFVFDSSTQNDVVFFAGGIGITPFMSMMRYATITQLPNHLTLIYSIRSAEDIAFREDLEAMAASNPNLRIILAVSGSLDDKLPKGIEAYEGRVSQDIITRATNNDLSNKTFFACGPPPFMQSIIGMLRERGVVNSRIITEAFSQGHGRQTSKTRGWQFNIYTLGALSTAATSVVVMTTDILKTLPSSILPETLTNENMPSKTSARQSDLDAIVNSLSASPNTQGVSPKVTTANKVVADAKAKIAEVNAKNAAAQSGATYVAPTYSSASSSSNTGSASSSSSSSSGSSSSGSTTTPPAPAPAPTPVCTTTPSGVTTCQ